MKRYTRYNKSELKLLFFAVTACLISVVNTHAQVPDPDQGLRASWMRGSWGLLWLPEKTYNGNIEGVTIDEFVAQIKDLRTLDYVQLGLTSPNIFSPVHMAPHDIIESLWQGDTDKNGDPINLCVPRASEGDPFLSWLKALKGAGLKVEVYVNSYNLLARNPDGIPAAYPDLSARWMNWCDTNAEAQAFINSKDYHVKDSSRRHYMFCYAEFILKAYAMRYGDLIDAWCFDSADNIMEGECGDNPDSENLDDLRIYQAFADACHAGNPNAAIAFNNSVGADGAPFSPATYFDDYSFGHPFGGAGNMVVPEILYTRNFAICQFMKNTNGLPFANDFRDWNDNVVGHFFPKQSTTSWNAGAAPCLTDSQFVAWNSEGLINGGAITWGTPLVRTNLENSPVLTLQPYALTQLTKTDEYLKQFQNAGKPNWARQYTVLPDAYIGQAYYHELVQGIDFWDTDGDASIVLVDNDALPSWLTVTESAINPGNFVLSGMPTETDSTDYAFGLRAEDAKDGTTREVNLTVLPSTISFTDPGDGSPVWHTDLNTEKKAMVMEPISFTFAQGKDFYDFEGDSLTISLVEESDWLGMVEVSAGIWVLSGIPTEKQEGVNNIMLSLNDGVNSTPKAFNITVNQPIIEVTDEYTDVQIRAAADSIYGVDSVATMVSDTITAPDGLATFQISIDVVPQSGKSIGSGISGGLSTSRAWGLTGDGRESTKDFLFFGDSADWVEIGNARVLNFNANGGELSLSDFKSLVFDSVTLVNAQSGSKDAVAYQINGNVTDLGNIGGTPYTVDIPNAQYFSLGVGNSPNQDKNKWSVEGINVAYSMGEFHHLNISAEHGSVEITPEQIAFKDGTTINLVAKADSGFLFEHWGGDTIDATIDADTLTVFMNADKSIMAVFSSVTGIPQTENLINYKISPNPSSGIFHVEMDQMNKAIYTVYSINGVKLVEGYVNGSFEFDLSNFEKGVYLFKIKSDQRVDVRKILLD
jgi:hypothetical protein